MSTFIHFFSSESTRRLDEFLFHGRIFSTTDVVNINHIVGVTFLCVQNKKIIIRENKKSTCRTYVSSHIFSFYLSTYT